VKPVEKRHGSGRGNWGTQEDELTGETEALGDKTEKAAADGAEKNAELVYLCFYYYFYFALQ
jgi:hypothetical protein